MNCGRKEVGKEVGHEVGKKAGKTEIGGTFQQHYIAENGDLQQSVLALQELDGQHTGQNQAESIVGVINDYGIASKVGYFMMDNANNNDTMMEALSTRSYELLLNIKA